MDDVRGADRPSGGERGDRPSGGERGDRPSGGERGDCLSGGEREDRPSGGERGDLARVDPFGPAWREDPWPVYARFRDEAPVHPYATGGWLVTRHDDAALVVRDRRFASDPAKLSDRGRAAVGDNAVYQAGSAVLLFTDPPDHTRLRSLVSKAFTPRVVTGLRPWLTSLVDGMLTPAFEAGELEVMADVAGPLPVEVICQLLGVPDGDRAPFRTWSAAASRLAEGGLSPEDSAAGMVASAELFGYFSALVEERRASPGDDLLSSLVAIEEAGDRLSTEELLTTVVLLFIAGHETTTNLIGNAVLALLDHPDQCRRLLADPSLARAAVEEALRYDGPVQLVPRVALEPVTLQGRQIEAGDSITVGLAAANRDPRRYPDPDRFDLARGDTHLAFGIGLHHCLGAALARLEAEVVLEALAVRAAAIELVGGRPRHRPHAIIRGLATLPVQVAPAR